MVDFRSPVGIKKIIGWLLMSFQIDHKAKLCVKTSETVWTRN